VFVNVLEKATDTNTVHTDNNSLKNLIKQLLRRLCLVIFIHEVLGCPCEPLHSNKYKYESLKKKNTNQMCLFPREVVCYGYILD